MTNNVEVFFVLKGRLNGTSPAYQYETNKVMEDGWYWKNSTTVLPNGPYDSKDEAEAAHSMPTFTIENIISALTSGKFRVMDDHDYLGYCGAERGSAIRCDWNGFDVIISPTNADCPNELVVIQAHSLKGDFNDSYLLTTKGWEQL